MGSELGPTLGLFYPLIRRWHAVLGLKPQSRSWYVAKIADEVDELAEARSPIERLSETSDILYLVTRSHQDGHPQPIPSQLSSCTAPYVTLAVGYFLTKLSLRWGLYRLLSRLCRRPPGRVIDVREVVNPSRPAKIRAVAQRHGFDAEEFASVCRRLRWVWPLLP